jgi:membrane associated rhomboid family serine protease
MFPIRDDQPRFSTPYVNYFIIALNVLVYVLFEVPAQFQGPRVLNALISQFALVPRYFIGALQGAPQYSLPAVFLTILTSMFLHGGFFHILGNMWFLAIFGDNIEDYLGHFSYLIFYLLCGIAAAAMHILFNFGSHVPMLGASGAISGVMGAYLLIYPRARVLTWVLLIFFWWLPAWFFLIYWFVFLSGVLTIGQNPGVMGGVAVWGHVGGFVAGLILIKIFPRRTKSYRYGSW